MPFKKYLTQLKARNDAEGDFVRLASADAGMPDVTTWEELPAHLVAHKASYSMLASARDVWSKYQKLRQKTEKV